MTPSLSYQPAIALPTLRTIHPNPIKSSSSPRICCIRGRAAAFPSPTVTSAMVFANKRLAAPHSPSSPSAVTHLVHRKRPCLPPLSTDHGYDIASGYRSPPPPLKRAKSATECRPTVAPVLKRAQSAGQSTFQPMTMTMVQSPERSVPPTTSTCKTSLPLPSVWQTVLQTGKFPDDLCLEDTTNANKPGNSQSPSLALHQFVADNLQCKSTITTTERFNALNLQSIMNNGKEDASVSSASDQSDSESIATVSPKKTKSPKRSDYSQHSVVRSGRWSIEEENYAKAMIEAFKAGYLPLHGNVSLRKFLAEVLVCHPMRISKKFVGYVRKYHWYRIAAGKCDPEARQQALHQLCQLEHIFWQSLQQNNEWPLFPSSK